MYHILKFSTPHPNSLFRTKILPFCKSSFLSIGIDRKICRIKVFTSIFLWGNRELRMRTGLARYMNNRPLCKSFSICMTPMCILEQLKYLSDNKIWRDTYMIVESVFRGNSVSNWSHFFNSSPAGSSLELIRIL